MSGKTRQERNRGNQVGECDSETRVSLNELRYQYKSEGFVNTDQLMCQCGLFFRLRNSHTEISGRFHREE